MYVFSSSSSFIIIMCALWKLCCVRLFFSNSIFRFHHLILYPRYNALDTNCEAPYHYCTHTHKTLTHSRSLKRTNDMIYYRNKYAVAVFYSFCLFISQRIYRNYQGNLESFHAQSAFIKAVFFRLKMTKEEEKPIEESDISPLHSWQDFFVFDVRYMLGDSYLYFL